METVGQRIGKELREFLAPALFFFVSFQLLGLTRMLALREYHVRVSLFVAATIGWRTQR